MSAIGILGGMGPQASSRLYELLIEGTQDFTPSAVDDDYPAIVLLNVPVPNFVSNTKNLAIARAMLIQNTKIMEDAGSTINGIACNTAHILLPDLQASTAVPFLSIPELVAIKIQESGFKRVGLLGTPTTLKSNLYDEVLKGKTRLIKPTANIAKQTEKVIYMQLNSKIGKTDIADFRLLVDSFISDKNLDAVILGCTELPLVYGKPKDNRVIDTLQVLSDGLLAKYFT